MAQRREVGQLNNPFPPSGSFLIPLSFFVAPSQVTLPSVVAAVVMFDVHFFASMAPDLQRTASFCSQSRRSSLTLSSSEQLTDDIQGNSRGRRPSTSSSRSSSSTLCSTSYDSTSEAEDMSPINRVRRRRRPSLRRTKRPKEGSLREVRAMQSDACLQQVYERHTLAYLEGTIDFRPPLESVSEDPD